MKVTPNTFTFFRLPKDFLHIVDLTDSFLTLAFLHAFFYPLFVSFQFVLGKSTMDMFILVQTLFADGVEPSNRRKS